MIIVPPFGRTPNDVLLIGEAPGKDEAAIGKDESYRRPFIGKAGKEQDWYLSACHLSARNWRLANVIPEYTPGNPDPTSDQISFWHDYLLAEVFSCNPKLIIAVGRFAMEWFLGPGSSLDACHGLPHRAGEFDSSYSCRAPEGCIIIPVHHPAGGFYKPRAKTVIQDDYFQVYTNLKKIFHGEDISIICDSYEGYEHYRDVTGEELSDLIANDRRHITRVGYDTEGIPSDPWSQQVCWKPGTSYCLRSSQSDSLIGSNALQSLADSGVEFITHCASTPSGTGYDIIMAREMGLNLSRAKIIDTMYDLYLLRNESKGLKSAAWRFARMKMEDYWSLVKDAAIFHQLAYLQKVVSGEWARPEKFIVKEPDGTYKFYRPQKIEQTAAGIIRDVESGKLNNKGETTDPENRWYNIDSSYRKQVESVIGQMPAPSLKYIKDQKKAIHYACRDADATLRIVDPVKEKHRQLDIIDAQHKSPFSSAPLSETSSKGNYILPLWESMQRRGMPGSRERFESLAEKMEEECDKFRHKLSKQYFDCKPFNPNSPKQTADLIGKLDIKLKGKKTKTGQLATDKKSIEYLRYEYPAMDDLFNFREHDHIRTSFCNAFLSTFPSDAEIHNIQSVLDPARTETRRLSSKEPNLLNVPSRTEIGRMVRDCFIAPEGWVYGSVDYSQIELRVMADESRDKILTGVFTRGEDPHKDYASYLFGRKDVTYDERYFGKTMNFAVGYGMSPQSMFEQLHKEGQRQWTLDNCILAHAEWFNRYSGFSDYRRRLIADSLRKGYVRDRGGMYRYLPNLRSSNRAERSEAERHCVSARIQGTAQTIIQNAMMKLKDEFEDFEDCQIESYLLLQYHDEIIFLCRRELASMTINVIKDAFINHCGMRLSVPVVSDSSIAESWGKL